MPRAQFFSTPLTSPKNPRLAAIRRAAEKGRPTEDGLVVIEGPHLIEETLRGQWPVEEVFVTSEARERYGPVVESLNAPVMEVSRRAMASIASTGTTQEILALARPRKWTWTDLLSGQPPVLLALDGVGDPGNAGTIVRSAEAFGASGVVFLRGTVRPYNGKLIRATAGSIFRVPFLEEIGTAEFTERCQSLGLPVFALMPGGGTRVDQARSPGGCVLVVGGEGAGVSAALQAIATPLTIPTRKVESLNAAVACSIALYAIQQGKGPL